MLTIYNTICWSGEMAEGSETDTKDISSRRLSLNPILHIRAFKKVMGLSGWHKKYNN